MTAAAIRKSVRWIAETRAAYDSRHDDDEFPEDRILTRLHQRKERNRRATDHKKQKVLQETSRLACEACGFDFAAIYGDLGYGFAECHHMNLQRGTNNIGEGCAVRHMTGRRRR